MGAKDLKEVVDLLKAICVYEKATLQEVQILRKEINANMKAQHEILNKWMDKDLDHHFKDNKVAMAVIEQIKNKEINQEQSAIQLASESGIPIYRKVT